jgi:hypothetical protein
MSAMGQKETSRRVPVMSVLPLKADIRQREWHVRFVPEAGHATTCSAWPPATLAIDPLPSPSLLRSRYFHAPCSQPGTLIAKKVLTRRLHIADFFRAFGRTRGSNAPISFPETLPLAERCCSGSNARFCCERPDRIRVPNSKHRHNRLRVPNSKHRHTERRDPVRVTGCAY